MDKVTEAINYTIDNEDKLYVKLYELDNATEISNIKDIRIEYNKKIRFLSTIFPLFEKEVDDKKSLNKINEMAHKRKIMPYDFYFEDNTCFLTEKAANLLLKENASAEIKPLKASIHRMKKREFGPSIFLEKKLQKKLQNTPTI